jgi:SAM-dependent methyltransferase
MAQPTDHFSTVARQYAQSRPSYPPELFDWLAAQCTGHDLAWDVGAGSGQAAMALAAHFARVLATDLSAKQLEQAPAHPAIEYRVAAAQHSDLPEASADLVTVAQALHWFDVQAFHREVRRVLKRGGLLAEWTYGIVHVEGESVDALVGRYYHHEAGPHWPAERRHVENAYADLPFPFPRIETPSFAMVRHWDLAALLGYVRSWSATARLQAVSRTDPVDALGERLRAHWGPPEATREIRWPLALRVGMA